MPTPRLLSGISGSGRQHRFGAVCVHSPNGIKSFIVEIIGNYQGHSMWHMLGAIAELEVVFWVDQRETNKKIRELSGKAA